VPHLQRAASWSSCWRAASCSYVVIFQDPHACAEREVQAAQQARRRRRRCSRASPQGGHAQPCGHGPGQEQSELLPSTRAA
jgi:hypothetical protein